MIFTKENNEVLYLKKDIISVNNKNLKLLSDLSKKNIDEKIRICFHSNINAKIHQMLILHKKNYYIRPHKVVDKTETGLILKGECDLILFKSNGSINKVIHLGSINNKSNKSFFYIIPKNTFHTLLIHKNLTFLETTAGPFNKKKVFMAQWSPSTDDQKAVILDYIIKLKNYVKKK